MWKIVLVCLAMLITSGCSSFHRHWREAAKTAVPPGSVEGRWEGTWVSDSNGHSGRLRCVLTKLSEREYEAHFHAKYKKILGFGYVAHFSGTHSNGVFHFSGDADLGKLAGGVYTYEGFVSPAKFYSTYDSKYDRGTFQMRRPE